MGLVRTNALAIGNSSGSGGANGVDLPTRLKSISANGGNKFVTLTLGYENTNLVTGVQINYKTDSYPASPADGQSITVSGAAESVKIEGLTNTLTYYFRVFLYHEVDSVKYYQTDITNARVTGIPRTVEVTGAVPQLSGDGYLAFTDSTTFTLSAPVGTTIIIGGGGQGGKPGNSKSGGAGGSGGRVYSFTLDRNVVEEPCTLTVGQAVGHYASYLTDTTLKIGNTTYSTSSGLAGAVYYAAPAFDIGGDGGSGGNIITGDIVTQYGGDGTGSGGGGGAGSVNSKNSHQGISYGGTGRYGGGGGGAPLTELITAYPGSGYKPGNPKKYTSKGVYSYSDDDDNPMYRIEWEVQNGAGGDGMSGKGGLATVSTYYAEGYYSYADAQNEINKYNNGTTSLIGLHYSVNIGGAGGGGGYSAGGGGGGSNGAYGGSGGNGICFFKIPT